MRTLFTLILATLLLAIPAIASEDDTGTEEVVPTVVLWDNGPFITSYGTGVDGADESVMSDPDWDYGFGCAFRKDNRLADDFDVPEGEIWDITSITLYGWQSDCGPPSTFIGVYIEIFDGPPETGTSVWGDLSTNVLTSTTWSNCYRVKTSDMGENTYRPIMTNVSEFSSPITLTAGTYFLCWMQEGSDTSPSNNPPITITGVVDTGNAIMTYEETWIAVSDRTGGLKGLPFIIEGTSSSTLEDDTEPEQGQFLRELLAS